MRVETLALEDFRNYARAEVTFAPGMNLLIGRNAQGKTNLLEAVYCLSGLGSPRAADAALVRDGCERALLHGGVLRHDRAVEIDLEIRPGRGSRALVNKTPIPGLRELSELCVSVFFGPDELSLVKGSPEGRRRFLDDLAIKVRPARHGLRREWERVLRQRNALLRSWPRGGGASASAGETLEVWDEAFVRAAAAITAARLEVLDALIPYAAKRYEAIAGGGRVELHYSSAWMEASGQGVLLDADWEVATLVEMLRERISETRGKEIERGVSLVGPQRDDVMVKLVSDGASLEARTHASQGDQRTMALALKLGEYDLLTEVLRDPPILLLDDVFSELDPARRGWLGDAVRDLGQAVLSSAEPGAADSAGAERVIEVGGSLRVDG